MTSLQAAFQQFFSLQFLRYGFVVMLTWLVYGNTLFNQYALDDWLITTSNHEQISRGVEAIPEIFTTHYISWQGYQVDYRPLVKASFALEYEFFGENPGVSHFINVLLFSIVCALLLFVLGQLLPNAPPWLLFLSIVIFVVHPVHTEVVASLKNRDELLSFFFILLVFHQVFAWIEKGSNWKTLFWMVTFLLLSLLSKASNVTWLATLMLWMFFYRNVELKKVLTLSCVLMATIAIYEFSVVQLLGDWLRSHIFIEEPFFQIESIGQKWASVVAAAGVYLKLLVYPQPLCSYYGFNQVPIVDWADWRVYMSILGYLLLIVLAVRGLFKRDIIGLGAIILLCDLLLFVNVIYPYTGIIGERVLFGGTIGFTLILIGTLKNISNVVGRPENGRIWIPIVCFGLCMAYGWKTVARNQDWKNNLTLFETDVTNCSNSAKLHELYALYLRGEYKNSRVKNWKVLAYKAIEENRKAIGIYEKWPIPYHRIGVIYHYDLGRPDSALSYYQTATKLNKDFIGAKEDLAQCLMELQRFGDAMEVYSQLLSADSSSFNYWNESVAAGFLAERINEAEQLCTEFEMKFPESQEPYIHKGNLFLIKGDTAAALAAFDLAFRIEPGNARFNQFALSIAESVGDSAWIETYSQGAPN